MSVSNPFSRPRGDYTEWEQGFLAGWEAGFKEGGASAFGDTQPMKASPHHPSKRKRKLSEWQKYVKVNSKKPRFKFKSGSKRGRVNFKALGIAFRKTPAGKKKRR